MFRFVGLLLSVLCFPNGLSFAASSRLGSPLFEDRIHGDRIVSEEEILDAKALLISLGVPERNLCLSKGSLYRGRNEDVHYALPECDPWLGLKNEDYRSVLDTDEERRFLQEEEEKEEEEGVSFAEDPVFFLTMAASALFCVVLAALAAGLTMGMLSLDPLMLLVKIRASRSPEEKRQAESLLPIVKQHHLLLVTLLLLNSIANEALPLFLDKLVSPVVAVLLSVSFVLM